MNLVGKIFIVLVFIMSIVFMSFSVMVYATHRDWKKESEQQAENLEYEQSVVQERTAERDNLKKQLEKQQAWARQSLAALETHKEVLEEVGAATANNDIEFTVDLALGLSRDAVLRHLDKIKQAISEGIWPPA